MYIKSEITPSNYEPNSQGFNSYPLIRLKNLYSTIEKQHHLFYNIHLKLNTRAHTHV